MRSNEWENDMEHYILIFQLSTELYWSLCDVNGNMSHETFVYYFSQTCHNFYAPRYYSPFYYFDFVFMVLFKYFIIVAYYYMFKF